MVYPGRGSVGKCSEGRPRACWGCLWGGGDWGGQQWKALGGHLGGGERGGGGGGGCFPGSFPQLPGPGRRAPSPVRPRYSSEVDGQRLSAKADDSVCCFSPVSRSTTYQMSCFLPEGHKDSSKDTRPRGKTIPPTRGPRHTPPADGQARPGVAQTRNRKAERPETAQGAGVRGSNHTVPVRRRE